MNTTARTKRRRSAWRLAGWLSLILLAPPLLWLAWNWNDEAPNAAAAELSRPLAHDVADADNAWLLFAGIGAAEGDDPIALGRRRVDAFNARSAVSVLKKDEPRNPLDQDPLPLQRPRLPQDSTPEPCPFRIVNCLDWTQAHAPTLARLRAANAVRQQRVARALTLPRWDNLYRLTLDTPVIDVGDLLQYFDLLANDAAVALNEADDAALATALARMGEVVRFFNAARAGSQDLLSLMLNVTFLTRHYLLLDQILDRLDAAAVAAHRPAIDAILAMPSAPFDWSETIRREYQMVADLTGEGRLGFVTDFHACVDRGEEKCVGRSIVGFAFKPQATRNRFADSYRDYRQAMNAQAPALKLALATARGEIQQRNAAFGDFGSSVRAVVYNPIGRTLVARAMPEFVGYAERIHDVEALRRSLVLKVEALQQGVGVNAIPAFLAEQPSALSNPWNGRAFEWDPRRREIGFVPGSNQWHRSRLGARYQPLPRAGVSSCAQPLRLELRETQGDEQRAVHAVFSCGVGNSSFLASAADESQDRERYIDVRAVAADGRIDIEALMQPEDGKLRLYETRGADAAATAAIWLDPAAVSGDGTRIAVTLAPADEAPIMVSVAARSMPARLLQQIATAAQLRIDHIELAGEQRVGMLFDIPAGDAIELIAAAAGLDVDARDARHFVLRRTSTVALDPRPVDKK